MSKWLSKFLTKNGWCCLIIIRKWKKVYCLIYIKRCFIWDNLVFNLDMTFKLSESTNKTVIPQHLFFCFSNRQFLLNNCTWIIRSVNPDDSSNPTSTTPNFKESQNICAPQWTSSGIPNKSNRLQQLRPSSTASFHWRLTNFSQRRTRASCNTIS